MNRTPASRPPRPVGAVVLAAVAAMALLTGCNDDQDAPAPSVTVTAEPAPAGS